MNHFYSPFSFIFPFCYLFLSNLFFTLWPEMTFPKVYLTIYFPILVKQNKKIFLTYYLPSAWRVLTILFMLDFPLDLIYPTLAPN